MKQEIEVDMSALIPIKVIRQIGNHEKLCPKCKGAAMVAEKRTNGRFLIACQRCYGKGVIPLCVYCEEEDSNRHRTVKIPISKLAN